jgi:asparagine synthase (glutamine-hydrolysing)
MYRIDRLSRLQSFLEAKDASSLFERTNQVFTDYELSLFLKRNTRKVFNKFMNDQLLASHNDDVDRVIAVDFQTFLADDILPKVDRATSYASIEGREPLLDHRIIEFAATLPSEYKLKNGKGKAILKHIVHKYIPKEIMDRPKMGFGLPINIWGLTDLKPLFDEYFDREFLRKQGIFSIGRVRELYDSYQSGNLLSFDRMYEIFIFQQWYKRWMM